MTDAVKPQVPGAELKALRSLHRALGLVLEGELSTALNLGVGNGALARHLAQGGTEVTVIDPSGVAVEAAQRTIHDPRVRFAVAPVSEISRHVEPASQDAILLIDTVEHTASVGLRWLLRDCRSALRQGGVCCVLSTEPRFATTVTAREQPPNPLEIEALRALLAESFEAVDVFTWNGTERFEEPLRCPELYAIAWAGDPYRVRSLALSHTRVAAAGEEKWIAAELVQQPSLPPRFLLRASLHLVAAPASMIVQLLFNTCDPTRYFWSEIRPTELVANPAQLMLASETIGCTGKARWAEVEQIVLRIRCETRLACDVRISDLRVLHA
jgi:2-polyprenyl-3-methyl-5-hydroxy-6-metoxy-1,4-benzoquinol methylase